jgi:VWFA-related protein
VLRAALLLLFAFAQDSAVFRADIAQVRIDAEVRTQDGPVSDLRQEEFRVFDNGRAQPVLHFAHDEQPLDVILLFDVSSSMRPVVARVAEAAHMALGELRAGDRAAVMAFSSNTDLIADFTGDVPAVETTIRDQVLKLSFRCCTHIQSALADAAKHFSRQEANPVRRAVIVVTDDDGTKADPVALRELWNADAVVLGVIVSKPGMTGPTRFGHFEYFGMRDIAARTGGDSLNTSDAAEGLRLMIERLRQRYSLYYALPPIGAPVRPGEERRVEIQLTSQAQARNPRAVVRARSGYFAPL